MRATILYAFDSRIEVSVNVRPWTYWMSVRGADGRP